MTTQAAAWQVMSTGPGGPGKNFTLFDKFSLNKTQNTLSEDSPFSTLYLPLNFNNLLF